MVQREGSNGPHFSLGLAVKVLEGTFPAYTDIDSALIHLFFVPCQDIIRQSAVEVEIEVRPHFIVPDTNCFVDHLSQLRVLAGGQTFQLMVPVVGECSSSNPCSMRLRGTESDLL